jgi:GntP family gluconate:H+ symporter
MIATLLAIATVVLLITALRLHPFLALILGSAVLGGAAGMAPSAVVAAFTAGVGATVGSVGLLVALGAMIGALVAASGAADGLVDTLAARVSARRLPWAMAAVATLMGLPLFFEVGVVLLVPVILLVSRRSDLPMMRIAIPALAGLSVLHGLLPPHPGPLVAIAALDADLGLTLAYGLVVAVPTVVVAGPLFGAVVGRAIVRPAPLHLAAGPRPVVPRAHARVPGARLTVATMLLPVLLMLLRAVGELWLPETSSLRAGFVVAGTPLVAMLAGVTVAMLTLGFAAGLDRREVADAMGAGLPPVAGILLIVGAGGGFKQTLVDAGVGAAIGQAASGLAMSPLVLGWLVAVGIRLATGSATVATTTAAGLVAPLAAGLDAPGVALLVLAIGSGSLFFSHVNDAGFWLVKEYFGLSVGETFRSWSAMETLISVVGLLGVLLLRAFV